MKMMKKKKMMDMIHFKKFFYLYLLMLTIILICIFLILSLILIFQLNKAQKPNIEQPQVQPIQLQESQEPQELQESQPHVSFQKKVKSIDMKNIKSFNELDKNDVKNYKNKKLIDIPKNNLYSNFLVELKNDFDNEIINKSKILCDKKVQLSVKNESLNKAFITVPNYKIINQNNEILDDFGKLDDNITDDVCIYKAISLSEYVNPMFYLTSNNTYFPPRWLVKTYTDMELPKHVNLKNYDNMVSYCKNKF